MRVGFDPRTLTLLGEAVPVPDRLLASGGIVLLEPSSSGALAYVSTDAVMGAGGMSAATRMVKVTDGGATSPFAFPERAFSDPRVSPDGTKVAVHGFEKGFDNWVADLKRGTLMRLTFDVGEDETPVWSPDGRSIAYSSTREGLERAVFRKAADGSGTEELLWSGKGHMHLGGFTPDGKTIVVSYTTGAPNDIGSLSVETGKLTPLLAAPYGEYDPALSKDGRWLAYTSDESGRPEVYVRSFPSLEGRWQVSIDGGSEPVWARDGRTLYFRGSGKILAVAVAPGSSFVPASPRAFVDDRFSAVQGDTHTGFDALPDGSLLMVQDTVERRAIRYVNLVVNWLQALSAQAKDTP
jgi:serine/threonine-protein kinase